MITGRELRVALDNLFRNSVIGEQVNQCDVLFQPYGGNCKWYRRYGDEWEPLFSAPQEVLDDCKVDGESVLEEEDDG